MAPRKRSSGREGGEEAPGRVTRSSTGRLSRYLNRGATVPAAPKKRIAKKPRTGSANAGASSLPIIRKTIVIEHCKQCNSFKTRAAQVKNGLENGVPGISVIVNPEKPRKGCFEIREEGGERFISLLNMSRPFTPMKDLDMEEVIASIIEKIK